MKGIYYNNSVATSQTPSQEHGNAPDGPGTLYLMPVPMSDAHPSTVLPTTNIELASRIKYFIVENVRSARRFLKRCDPSIVIDELHFEVLNVDTAPETVDAMIKPLTGGHDMAIISEAGCPAVADPGALAVAAAQRKGVKVVPLVGPSSILMALMGSGFNGQSFAFRGYLPIKPDERQAALKRMEKPDTIRQPDPDIHRDTLPQQQTDRHSHPHPPRGDKTLRGERHNRTQREHHHPPAVRLGDSDL